MLFVRHRLVEPSEIKRIFGQYRRVCRTKSERVCGILTGVPQEEASENVVF